MHSFPQRRLIAALLPAFFLWAFVACISICERDTVNLGFESGSPSSSVCIREVRGAFDCAACPLSFSAKAPALERIKIAFSSESSCLPFESPQARYSDPILGDKPLTRRFSTGSPPLELLSALRI